MSGSVKETCLFFKKLYLELRATKGKPFFCISGMLAGSSTHMAYTGARKSLEGVGGGDPVKIRSSFLNSKAQKV